MNVRKPVSLAVGAPSGYGGFLFPKMGGPPNHPFRDGIVHEINKPSIVGSSHLWKYRINQQTTKNTWKPPYPYAMLYIYIFYNITEYIYISYIYIYDIYIYIYIIYI